MVSIIYLASLFADNYQGYLSTGQPNAINGRYLFPVLPLILILFGLAFRELLKRWRTLQFLIGAIAIVTLVWGGGVFTYILRSNDAWYWPSRPVVDANHAVQKVLSPLTPGYNDPTAFLDYQ
jgi:hypothetical protein